MTDHMYIFSERCRVPTGWHTAEESQKAASLLIQHPKQGDYWDIKTGNFDNLTILL